MSQLQGEYIIKDEIMDTYYKLSTLNIIPDMGDHAAEWQLLSIKANQAGRYSTAQTYRTRSEHYCALAGGSYIRLVHGCFAELIPA